MTPTIDHCRTFATRCVSEGLSHGLGTPQPGQMCIEALWCNVLGLPHSDDPQCVAVSVRQYKIRLNDAAHASNEARAKCLVRLGVAQMGSKGVVDDDAFKSRVCELVIREMLPPVFRSLADRIPKHSASLLAAADRCESEGSREAARAARDAAAATYPTYAAYAASYAAADAADAAYAAYAYAAYAADAAAAADAADAALGRYLQHAANIGERVLRELGSPGIAWLDQLEAEGVVPAMAVVDLAAKCGEVHP